MREFRLDRRGFIAGVAGALGAGTATTLGPSQASAAASPRMREGLRPSRRVQDFINLGMHLTPETPTYSMRGCGGLPADAGGV